MTYDIAPVPISAFIELDQKWRGVRPLTISQHMPRIWDRPTQEVGHLYPAFCRFGKLLRCLKYIINLRSKPDGKCIVFTTTVNCGMDRAGYSRGQAVNRYLRGTYTDRAEMRSRTVTGSRGRF